MGRVGSMYRTTELLVHNLVKVLPCRVRVVPFTHSVSFLGRQDSREKLLFRVQRYGANVCHILAGRARSRASSHTNQPSRAAGSSPAGTTRATARGDSCTKTPRAFARQKKSMRK